MATRNLYAYVKFGQSPDPTFLSRSYFKFEILDFLNALVSIFVLVAKLSWLVYDKILAKRIVQEVKPMKKDAAQNTLPDKYLDEVINDPPEIADVYLRQSFSDRYTINDRRFKRRILVKRNCGLQQCDVYYPHKQEVLNSGEIYAYY